MRREGAKKSTKKKTMPKVEGNYSSRYKKKDNSGRGKVEDVKPTYPSRYK